MKTFKLNFKSATFGIFKVPYPRIEHRSVVNQERCVASLAKMEEVAEEKVVVEVCICVKFDFFQKIVILGGHAFNFRNNCPFTVWVGALGNSGKPAPQNGG